jgi:hypothetical protein
MVRSWATPRVVAEQPALPEVMYVINFEDATNPSFLERFAAFDGPKNTGDLGADSDLIVPDLRDRGFALS